jgi:hypothetical protein
LCASAVNAATIVLSSIAYSLSTSAPEPRAAATASATSVSLEIACAHGALPGA